MDKLFNVNVSNQDDTPTGGDRNKDKDKGLRGIQQNAFEDPEQMPLGKTRGAELIDEITDFKTAKAELSSRKVHPHPLAEEPYEENKLRAPVGWHGS